MNSSNVLRMSGSNIMNFNNNQSYAVNSSTLSNPDVDMQKELYELDNESTSPGETLATRYIMDKNKLNSMLDKFSKSSFLVSNEKEKKDIVNSFLQRRDEIYKKQIDYTHSLSELKQMFNVSQKQQQSSYNLSSFNMTLKQNLIVLKRDKQNLNEVVLRWNMDLVEFERNPHASENRSFINEHQRNNYDNYQNNSGNNQFARSQIDSVTNQGNSFAQFGNSVLYNSINTSTDNVNQVQDLQMLEKQRQFNVDRGRYDFNTFVPLEQKINSIRQNIYKDQQNAGNSVYNIQSKNGLLAQMSQQRTAQNAYSTNEENPSKQNLIKNLQKEGDHLEYETENYVKDPQNHVLAYEPSKHKKFLSKKLKDLETQFDEMSSKLKSNDQKMENNRLKHHDFLSQQVQYELNRKHDLIKMEHEKKMRSDYSIDILRTQILDVVQSQLNLHKDEAKIQIGEAIDKAEYEKKRRELHLEYDRKDNEMKNVTKKAGYILDLKRKKLLHEIYEKAINIKDKNSKIEDSYNSRLRKIEEHYLEKKLEMQKYKTKAWKEKAINRLENDKDWSSRRKHKQHEFAKRQKRMKDFKEEDQIDYSFSEDSVIDPSAGKDKTKKSVFSKDNNSSLQDSKNNIQYSSQENSKEVDKSNSQSIQNSTLRADDSKRDSVNKKSSKNKK